MNERERAIIAFVANYKVASHTTLREIFFADVVDRIAYRVLKKLADYGELDRERNFLVNEYIYWIPKSKPKQIKHSLLVTEFYRHLCKEATIVRFDIEVTDFDGARPDAFAGYQRADGKKYIAFVEVEISGNEFNLQKYIDLYESGKWRDRHPVFPLIVAVTNKKYIKNDTPLKLIQIREDFEDFRDKLYSI
jgi:hypothetical protein